jgi:GH15 family glucan-1,4-alpha-glucosidase
MQAPVKVTPPPAYSPIRDYALIGDCHGCALVSRAGGIDWCAFGRFDAPPVFCRILDSNKGEFFSITPSGPFETERSYLDGTNILRTVFKSDGGSVAVTDYMPVGRRPGASAPRPNSAKCRLIILRVMPAAAPCVLATLPTSSVRRTCTANSPTGHI